MVSSTKWEWATPLRRAADRRQALVEIDAIVAIMLGITAEELLTDLPHSVSGFTEVRARCPLRCEWPSTAGQARVGVPEEGDGEAGGPDRRRRHLCRAVHRGRSRARYGVGAQALQRYRQDVEQLEKTRRSGRWRDTGLLDDATFDRLADAVVALDPQPRERRWVSLSLCIVDAVWSIGANYDSVVVPLVRKLAAKLGVEQPTVPAEEPIGADPLPATRLAELGLDVLPGSPIGNGRRLATGYSKPMRYCATRTCFVEHGVTTLAEAIELFADEDRFARVDAALRSIPGEGSARDPPKLSVDVDRAGRSDQAGPDGVALVPPPWGGRRPRRRT